MKLSELFRSIGQPFSYYPQFVHRFDISVNSCVLLCFIGWRTFEDEIGNWRHFSTEEITKSTGLTPREQATSRKELGSKGLMEDTYFRLEHKLMFRLTGIDVDGKWPFADLSNASPDHSTNAQMGNRQMRESSNGQVTDQELTKKEGRSALPPEALFWNSNCGSLPKVMAFPVNRQKKLKQRRLDSFWVENFEEAVRKIARSGFCLGNSDRGWRASFDWLIERPDALAKVMEGKYDDRNETYAKNKPDRNVGIVQHQTVNGGLSKAERVIARRKAEETKAMRDSVADEVAGFGNYPSGYSTAGDGGPELGLVLV